MKFKELHLSHFRNFDTASLIASSAVNLVIGPNGSGKTSIVEAIYLLGRGRSFRSSDLLAAVKHGHLEFVVRGVLEGGDGIPRKLGCRKAKGTKGLETRLDGEDVRRREDLVSLLPLILISSESFPLVEGGPKFRRQFVDWGLFHVEQSGRDAWKEFRRALKQRNAALHQKGSDQLALWTRELANSGSALDHERRRFIERFNTFLRPQATALLGTPAELEYRVGWTSSDELFSVLMDSIDSDRRGGFTRTGPHAANISLAYGSINCREQVSRGQSKLLVISLMLSLVALIKADCGLDSVVLVDDVAAELDPDNQRQVVKTLRSLDTQLFITGTQFPAGVSPDDTDVNVFHVKHDEIRRFQP